MSLKTVISLFLIILIAFFLRLYKIAEVPPSLNWDEISHGYNAFSILKTGKDQWGHILPFFNFRAYGDYPLPLYMYLSMPFVYVFGLNEISIRIVSVIFGVLLVPVVYFLTKRATKNQFFALISALLLAISPWSILTSRQALQATPAIFFMSLGIILFIKGAYKRKKWTVFGTIFIGLSAYAYHNTRILAFPVLILLIIIYREHLMKYKKILFSNLLVAALFLLPLIPVILSTQGNARARWVGIIDQGAINNIEYARNTSELPALLNYLINNRYVYSAKIFTENYVGYFSPEFLGFRGGTNLQFSLPDFGLIYKFELPFFYLGLLLLLLAIKENREMRVIALLILLAPIPAAITRDPYQAVRSIFLLPFIYFVISYGMFRFAIFLKEWRKATVILLLFAGIGISAQFIKYFYTLINVYPYQSSFAWQYGYKQVMEFVKTNGSEYAKIIVTKKYGEPHEFVLFYTEYDPALYQNDATAVKYQAYDWFWVDKFGKFEFLNDEDIPEKTKDEVNALLITTPDNYPPNDKLLERINFLDGTEAFDIVRL